MIHTSPKRERGAERIPSLALRACINRVASPQRIGQNASVLLASSNTSAQPRVHRCVRVPSYRVCAVSFNSAVAADVVLATLGTTQQNASR